MATWRDFFGNVDWLGLGMFLFSALASLLCITLHELSHGYAACRLGDMTAKNAGRLTLNPIKHIDLVGLLMLVTVHVGWAKPVPINMRNFKHPKRDMALTALAGPLANFVLAAAALGVGSVFMRLVGVGSAGQAVFILALMYIAVLSVGLGVFNLIPIPPLDGSKILLSFLPDPICYTVLRYERYIGLAMLLLVWLGALDGVLDALMGGVLRGLCFVTRFPFEMLAYYFF